MKTELKLEFISVKNTEKFYNAIFIQNEVKNEILARLVKFIYASEPHYLGLHVQGCQSLCSW